MGVGLAKLVWESSGMLAENLMVIKPLPWTGLWFLPLVSLITSTSLKVLYVRRFSFTNYNTYVLKTDELKISCNISRIMKCMAHAVFGKLGITDLHFSHVVLHNFSSAYKRLNTLHLTWRVPRIIILEEQSPTIRSDALVSAILHVCIQQIHETLSFCFNSLIGKQ